VSGGFEKGNSAKLNYFLNAKVILLIIDFMLSNIIPVQNHQGLVLIQNGVDLFLKYSLFH